MKKADILAVFVFAAVFAAGAADLITAREATNIAEYVVSTSTNAARGVDGAVRMLPKYLHYAEFDDSYAADAAAWYERCDAARTPRVQDGGGCSVLRRGNVVGRNFDWPLDEAAEFVVRVSPLGSRHGSVGIATLGTNLTERMVTSGKHTELYRVLPGRTVDGINDAGLVAEVNVIPYDPASSPTQSVTRTLHACGVVRYALDNFGSAREAAEYVAEHYYIPEGSEYAYHWSFSDAEGSWIVEDGRCAKATQGQVMSMSMTNFRIWWVTRFIDPETGRIDRSALAAEDPYGTGVERFEAMYGTEDVAAALETVSYTKTYLAATEPRRISEFAAEGVAQVDEAEALSNVAERVIAAWPGREAARAQGIWWQTVHSSIYDIEKRTLSVAAQEDFSKRYVFAVGDGARVPHPESADLERGASTNEYEVVVNPGSVTTLFPPAANEDRGVTIGVRSTGLRCYTVFLRNDERTREWLPIELKAAFPEGLTAAYVGRRKVTRLPCRVSVCEPRGEFVAVDISELRDDFDWTPVVTNCFIEFSLASSSFRSAGWSSLLGRNLQAGRSLRMSYADEGGVTRTVTLLEAGEGEDFSDRTEYGRVGSVYCAVPSGERPPASSARIPATLTYETVNGRAVVRWDVPFVIQ